LYIAWIFIGNFILLNLFLAILLDSFFENDEADVDQDEVERALKAKK
jgi:regulatory protein YycI of two-component signal transduction system YycFG